MINNYAVAFLFDNQHENQPWHVVSVYVNDDNQAFYYGNTRNRDGRNPDPGHLGLLDSIDSSRGMYLEVFKIVKKSNYGSHVFSTCSCNFKHYLYLCVQ